MSQPKDLTMKGFKEKILEWKLNSQNEKRALFCGWDFLHECLFKGTTPESTTWSNNHDIVKILNIVGAIPAYNHMLFSDIGALDFEAAEKGKEKESKIDLTHRSSTKPSSDKFVKDNYKYWSFSDVVNKPTTHEKNNILFYFGFKGVGSRFSFLRKEGMYLSGDLIIKEISHANYSDMYTCASRDIAIEIQHKLNDRIKEFYEDAGYDYPELNPGCFSIQFVRIGSPTHLFTKTEIYELLKNANYRQTNQLVIDENGYAKLLIDSNDGQLYPVRHESWDAGNLYVEDYSLLHHLDETYISSLEGWLSYLETDHSIYKDYIEHIYSEKELIEKINAYYK